MVFKYFVALSASISLHQGLAFLLIDLPSAVHLTAPPLNKPTANLFQLRLRCAGESELSERMGRNPALLPLVALSFDWTVDAFFILGALCNSTQCWVFYLRAPISMEIIFFFPLALRPNAGHGLLILEVSRSHTTTHHSR